MSEVREEQLLEDRKMRQELIGRTEVLEKVKKLVTLPNTELLTTKIIAEYYEVSEDVIRDNLRRHRDELESNGAKTLKYREIKDLVNCEMFSQLKISRNGSVVFSIRATLNMGMLLRDSVVAREIRNQLLNGFEKLTVEQKLSDIELEDQLIVAAVRASTSAEKIIAMNEYNNFHNRHKAELNARIEEMKPKEEAFDIFISTEGYQKMNDVAKSVGYGRNKLYEFLRKQKVLMKDNQPYQSYIDREWFTVKQNTIQMGNFIKNHAQTYASPKGIDGISKMLKKHGLID